MLLLRQSQAGSSSSFLSGFHSGCVDVEQFKANVLAFPYPPYPLCLLRLIPQSDGCLNWALMAGLWGFTSHWSRFYLGAGFQI